MAVIFSEYSGGRLRKCTARCYNGKPTARCRCVCGGRNHGLGYDLAIERQRRELEQLAESPWSVIACCNESTVEEFPGKQVVLRLMIDEDQCVR